MLSLVLRRPLRTPNAYVHSTFNHHLTIVLTFPSTILKQTVALNVLEHAIPGQELASRPNGAFGLQNCWTVLTSGVAPPLSEDCCMGGVQWVGCKLFEGGYRKLGDDRKAELEAE